MTKNINIDKYGYSGYGIGFDGRSSFLIPGGGFDQNVIIFGVDMSSSAHIDNKKKEKRHISSWKGPTQGSKHTLTAEKMYSINFTEKNKKVCLSLHYNREIVTYLLMVQKFTNLKQKILKLLQALSCLRK